MQKARVARELISCFTRAINAAYLPKKRKKTVTRDCWLATNMVRFKNRYITVEIEAQGGQGRPLVLKTTALHHAIQDKVEKLYGDFGLASIKSGFNAKYCNAHTKIALIKVRHGPHKFIIDSVPSINDVGGHFVNIRIIYIGATMKHCFLYIKKHQQKKLEETWGGLRNDIEREKMREALMSLTSGMKDFK